MTDRHTVGRGRDDGYLDDEPETPGFSGSAGGGIATDVGARDEEKSALDGDPMNTRVTKQDKVQPPTGTRSDHEGAQR